MNLPAEIREQFCRHGRQGGRKRASGMSPEARTAVARKAATTRWIRQRFGASTFAELGLPGGDMVDAGLADLAEGRTTAEGFLVSLAAPRLRREGVPIGATEPDPEERLYALLAEGGEELAHARYGAHLRQAVSFANACRYARLTHTLHAP